MVTGAFGYSGRYIAQKLLDCGHRVSTLTNSPDRPNPFGGRVTAHPLCFDDPVRLTKSLQGIDALINTYWVRFDHRAFTHEEAVNDSLVLFAAAKAAGVRRVVHVSITNPDPGSTLPYFRGKAEVEDLLRATGLSHCILRPAVLFGKEDVLINNIAWGLRHLPVFGVFGDGRYRLQPIHVQDLAAVAAAKTLDRNNEVLQAIGPETFSYRKLVVMIAEALGLRRRIVSMPPALGFAACWFLGLLLRDVILTRQEIRGLMEERLWVDAPPLGQTKLSAWVREHRDTLGRRYTSELARRFDRQHAYRSN